MRRALLKFIVCGAFAVSAAFLPAGAGAAAKIVLIAGRPSHGPGEHEFNAGTQILVDCLRKLPGIEPVMVKGGWPADESVFEGAKAVVFYMDGGSGHPMIQGDRLATMKKLMDKGVGLVCLHYAVEYPKGVPGDTLLEWLGGYYETGYSTNPINDVQLTPAERHAVTRGVRPFQARDEWYYRIRFRPDDKRVTPVLTTMLPKDNPKQETVAWVCNREGGGRAFGFTGAHFHTNWGIRDFRTMVLNAILWTAHEPVRRDGTPSEVTADQLKQNLDAK